MDTEFIKVKGVKFSFVLNVCHKDVWVRGGTDSSTILDLGTICRWVLSFTPQLLYLLTPEKCPPVPTL
jgi:hypothetical protein